MTSIQDDEDDKLCYSTDETADSSSSESSSKSSSDETLQTALIHDDPSQNNMSNDDNNIMDKIHQNRRHEKSVIQSTNNNANEMPQKASISSFKRNRYDHYHSHSSNNYYSTTKNTKQSPSLFQQNNWTVSPEVSSLQTSLSSKSSPFALKPWVSLSQTLDGRDKITKVIQYTSRLLGFYYESIHPIHNPTRAQSFRRLQQALTQARKPFRFGKSLNEIQKLKDLGLVHWLAYYLRQFIVNVMAPSNDGGASTLALDGESVKDGEDSDSNGHDGDDNGVIQSVASVHWHPNVVADDGRNTTSTIHASNINSNKKSWTTNTHPPSIILSKEHQQISDPNSDLSSSPLKKILYQYLSQYIDESKLTQNQNGQITISNEPPPIWKILTSALKIIGLAGFWAGDNVAYLHTAGFLKGSNRKKESAIFATRSYFFACVVGLYTSCKEWIEHRNGPLRQAFQHFQFVNERYEQIKASSSQPMCTSNDNTVKEDEKKEDEGRCADIMITLQEEFQLLTQERDQYKLVLDQAKKKHTKLCLAMLKSCCDVTVFSNNPGVDLHLKYRGKKMNEGIQCVAGITSALTVLYNNYV